MDRRIHGRLPGCDTTGDRIGNLPGICHRLAVFLGCMHDIYLIRHTTPAVAKGICYGQTDLDITESFPEEDDIIRRLLPADIGLVYSSPLTRCTRLAEDLFPDHSISLEPHLMEVFCGEWEMRHWDQ